MAGLEPTPHRALFPSELNALDFGVPQFRERVFFAGTKKDKLIRI